MSLHYNLCYLKNKEFFIEYNTDNTFDRWKLFDKICILSIYLYLHWINEIDYIVYVMY